MNHASLIVQAHKASRSTIEEVLASEGSDATAVTTLADARRALGKQRFDLVVLDVKLPDGSGFDLLTEVPDAFADVSVIVTATRADARTVVRAMKAGATDVLDRPIDPDHLRQAIQSARRNREPRPTRPRSAEIPGDKPPSPIVGESSAIEQVRDQIRKIAPFDSSVLVYGETGTGKEPVAEWIHHLSSRSNGPFIRVNCGRFSESLLESELFGHERGAFTDAKKAKPGLFEQAEGGTVFLDEVSQMKPELQVKLLRVVEGHPFRRIGGTNSIQTNFRLIAGTNGKLLEAIKSGAFREDLYYRLKGHQIDLPPLRERGDDVVILARHFLQRFLEKYPRDEIPLSQEAEQALLAYPWPGNVRELKTAITTAAVLCEPGEIQVVHLPADVLWSGPSTELAHEMPKHIIPLDEWERLYMKRVVNWYGGNLSKAARSLGISRTTLWRKSRTSTEDS
ncbi:MAG: sigma-54 dependent transcriptional regulator [Planctomycetota bacterium]|nr:sigma-54 dependent transcriptional regulator [Planctomycetota bacterium]